VVCCRPDPEGERLSTQTEKLMTAEEFLKKYGDCSGVELVRGRVVWAGREEEPTAGGGRMPRFKHGVVCHNADALIGGFVRANNLGWIAVNDTFVPVGTASDTVRGADLLFVSYARLPKAEAPEDLKIPPDLVIEVRSPSDRLNAVIAKATEYIDAGVRVVLVLDPKTESAAVHRLDEFAQVFHDGDELTLPDVLPGFSVPVKAFFE
jgi:Uma2 family endonuclease